MIKSCRLPARGGVTHLALLRDPGGHVIGIPRSLEILKVTRNAGRRSHVEIAICMALIALQLRVSARQRKTNRIVIEASRLPRRSRMAILATLGESERNVIRITGLLEVGEMTTYTGRRRSRELAPSVT